MRRILGRVAPVVACALSLGAVREVVRAPSDAWPRPAFRQEAMAGPSVQEAPASEGPSPEEALARYREAAEGSDDPIDFYNLGTALLIAGRVADARQPLEQSLGSEREVVRLSANYNYGLSAGLEGRFFQDDPSARRQALHLARDAFRDVLRDSPDDEDARWNLEVIQRWLEEEERSGGEGSQGGQGQSQGGAGAGGAPSGGQGLDELLSPEDAAALLDQAGEAEASIRDRVMGRNRFREPVVERNW